MGSPAKHRHQAQCGTFTSPTPECPPPDRTPNRKEVGVPEVSPRIRGGLPSSPSSLLGLVEGSVVLTPIGILFLGPRGSVTPLVCSVVEVAVVAVAVGVAVATVVFRVCEMEAVVGP